MKLKEYTYNETLKSNDAAPVAVEFFASSWCNLKCTYCYIPKDNDMILNQHKKIIEEAKLVEPLIAKINRVYDPNDVTHFSHWGSEPSLTIKYFKDFYKRAAIEYPNIKQLTISSNFIANTDDVIDFLATFPDTKNQVHFQIQISLDGPEWITEPNRGIGTTQKIIKNIFRFIEGVNKIEGFKHRISSHFKPTLTNDQYMKLAEADEMYKYYAFFDDVCKGIKERNVNNVVDFTYRADSTVVCLTSYTQQDGINLAKMNRSLYDLIGHHNFEVVKPTLGQYFNFFTVTMDNFQENYMRPRMTTCSAGDSMHGFGDALTPCHDLFYIRLEDYENSIYKSSNRLTSEHQMKHLRLGTLENAKKHYSLLFDELTDDSLLKYTYRLRGFHDFMKLRLSMAVAVIKLMASAGQVSSVYNDPMLATALAIFSYQRHSCLTSHLQGSASIHVLQTGYYKLFGNGLVEDFLKYYAQGMR